MESSGFSIYDITSSSNRDSFTFSILIWMPLIPFSCLILLAKTSKTMLNKSGKSENPSLFLILWKNLSFLLINMMLPVLCCVGTFPLYPLYWEFLSWMNIKDWQRPFLRLLRSYDFFILHVVNVVCNIESWLILWMLNHPCPPGINSASS